MITWDVIVIGGGIHGVGVAQAAVAAGHRTLLLERASLASGTSSKSSKLIHGGLRYLEQGELRLVRECLRERSLLLRLAPDLVQLRPFLLPVFTDGHRRPAAVRAGLSVYAMLGGLGPDVRFASVPRREWGDLDGITTTGLRRVFRYYDAQTDDRDLTRAVAASAVSLGAELRMRAALRRAVQTPEGVIVEVSEPGGLAEYRGRVLVNAAGPWANDVLNCFDGAGPPRRSVDLVQGVHVDLPVPTDHGVYYVEAPQDGRGIFRIPRGNVTTIGTTEHVHDGPADTAQATESEIDYLLEAAAHSFPHLARFSRRDVMNVTAGLRVLPRTEGAAFRRSRETVLLPDAARPRVLTIYGGKLTAYRATAQRVLDAIAPALPARRAVADTRTLPLRPVSERELAA